MIGGLTSRMLHLRRADGGADVVVRQWSGEREWEADRVRGEAAGLSALAGSGLPLPRFIAADPEGAATGRPTTLTSFVDGEVELTPDDLPDWVRQLARMLATIHATPLPHLEHCRLWFPDSERNWLTDRTVATEALDLAARSPAVDDLVLSHGDYQHFNVLWRDGRLTNVVDWTGVGLATRGFDVGHCRLNLAVLFSPDAAMQFLDDYEAAAGVRVDPAPDLQRLLCFDDNWPEFIPLQVAGRRPVDGPGMAARVQDTITRTLHRVG